MVTLRTARAAARVQLVGPPPEKLPILSTPRGSLPHTPLVPPPRALPRKKNTRTWSWYQMGLTEQFISSATNWVKSDLRWRRSVSTIWCWEIRCVDLWTVLLDLHKHSETVCFRKCILCFVVYKYKLPNWIRGSKNLYFFFFFSGRMTVTSSLVYLSGGTSF